MVYTACKSTRTFSYRTFEKEVMDQHASRYNMKSWNILSWNTGTEEYENTRHRNTTVYGSLRNTSALDILPEILLAVSEQPLITRQEKIPCEIPDQRSTQIRSSFKNSFPDSPACSQMASIPSTLQEFDISPVFGFIPEKEPLVSISYC